MYLNQYAVKVLLDIPYIPNIRRFKRLSGISRLSGINHNLMLFFATFTVMAKGDAREVGHTISDSSQYLACIMFINLFSASIKI